MSFFTFFSNFLGAAGSPSGPPQNVPIAATEGLQLNTLDADAEYLTVQGGDALDFNQGVTLIAWSKLDADYSLQGLSTKWSKVNGSLVNGYVIDDIVNGGAHNHEIYQDNAINFSSFTREQFSVNPPSLQQWSMNVFTITPSEQKAYYRTSLGFELGTTNTSANITTISTAASPLQFGALDINNLRHWMNGQVYALMIFTGDILSPAQLAQLWHPSGQATQTVPVPVDPRTVELPETITKYGFYLFDFNTVHLDATTTIPNLFNPGTNDITATNLAAANQIPVVIS